MPLRFENILLNLDLDVQVTVTTVYLEMCRSVETETSSEEFEKARHTIARCVLRLARDGERDASVMKVKVAQKLRRLETAESS